MILELILFIPIIFLCFFLLFVFSRQDFVLLRQNISLAEIFDLASFTLLFAIFTGRVALIFNNLDFRLLNFLAFFHFLKYPGLSYLGFFIGAAFMILFLLRGKKSIARVFDIFSISSFPIVSFFIINQIWISHFWLLLPIAIVLIITFFALFIYAHNKYKLKDGSVSGILLLVVGLTTFLLDYLSKSNHKLIFTLSFSELLAIPIILFSLIFISLNQRRK